MKAVNKPTVLYIAGYGRSGSTLIDLLLGNHPAFFGAGEFTNIFGEILQDRNCSCGMPLGKCELWSEVFAEFNNSIGKMDAGKADRLTRSTEILFSLQKSDRSYVRLWTDLLRCLFAVTGPRILVDSSKTSRFTYRRMFLLSRCGLDVRCLHIVRDPRGVMWSARKGSNKVLGGLAKPKIFRGMLRGLLGWIYCNGLVEVAKQRLSSNYLTIKYEDLVTQPINEIEKIGRYMGVDMAPLMKKMAGASRYNTGHGIAGNRMRQHASVAIQPDSAWHAALPITGRILAFLSWPLARRYGYKLARRA